MVIARVAVCGSNGSMTEPRDSPNEPQAGPPGGFTSALNRGSLIEPSWNIAPRFTHERCEPRVPKGDSEPDAGHRRNVAVLWDDGTYYPGVVTRFNVKTGEHTIVYNDGDVEVLNLSAVKHKWLPGSAVPTPLASPAKPSPKPTPKPKPE